MPYTLIPQDNHSIDTFSPIWVDHFSQGGCAKSVGENLFNQYQFLSADFKPRDKLEFRVRYCRIITRRLLRTQNCRIVCMYLPYWLRRLSALVKEYHSANSLGTLLVQMTIALQYCWANFTLEEKEPLYGANLNASRLEHKNIHNCVTSSKKIDIY